MSACTRRRDVRNVSRSGRLFRRHSTSWRLIRSREHDMRIRTQVTVKAIRLARGVILGLSLVVLVPSEAPAQMAGVIKNLFDQVTINQITANPSTAAGAPATIDHRSHFFLGGENLTTAVRQ